jgi:hypothetical protein
MRKVKSEVVCHYIPNDTESRECRLLYVDQEDEDDGIFLIDAKNDNGHWVPGTDEELLQVMVVTLYEFWQKLKALGSLD